MREDLSDEDVNRLDSVRKQIWAAGYTGFFIGGAWGLGNCVIYKGLQAKAVEKFPKQPAFKSLPVLQNKHFVMWSLVAAATGMFMGAGMAGIKGNEDLRDIYDRRTGGSLTQQQESLSLPPNLPRDAPEYHVAKASADSHRRRMEAIRAKRAQDRAEREGASKKGAFKEYIGAERIKRDTRVHLGRNDERRRAECTYISRRASTSESSLVLRLPVRMSWHIAL
eukprot:g19944.t1